jgi:two-component system phosphate regulon response regulator PhoB
MSARIMVVEDEEALTTLLRYNLDAEGYDVETVARGDDADTRLKERVPDLVVLDWMLPGCQASTLPAPAGAAGDQASCRSSCSRRAARRASGCGGWRPVADDYIVKPFSVPECWRG